MKTITTTIVLIEEVPDDEEVALVSDAQYFFDNHEHFQKIKVVVTNIKVTGG